MSTEQNQDQEQQLLDILHEEDLPDAAGLDMAEEVVASAFPHLDKDARKTMARVLISEMPTPEEIEQAEKIAQHNAGIQVTRDEKLRQRKERQAKRRGS